MSQLLPTDLAEQREDYAGSDNDWLVRWRTYRRQPVHFFKSMFHCLGGATGSNVWMSAMLRAQFDGTNAKLPTTGL